MAQRGAIEPLSAAGALIFSGLAEMSANKQNLEGNLRFRYRTHLKNGRDTECTVWEKKKKKKKVHMIR